MLRAAGTVHRPAVTIDKHGRARSWLARLARARKPSPTRAAAGNHLGYGERPGWSSALVLNQALRTSQLESAALAGLDEEQRSKQPVGMTGALPVATTEQQPGCTRQVAAVTDAGEMPASVAKME